MQLWKVQKIPLGRQAFTLGGTYTFTIPTQSVIAALNIGIDIPANATAAATAAPEGVANLVRSAVVQGSLKVGGSLKPTGLLAGGDYFDVNQTIRFSYPNFSGTLGATPSFLRLPLIFEQPRLQGFLPNVPSTGNGSAALPLRFMSCLPAKDCASLTLTVQAGVQSDLDTNAVPTFALPAGCTIFVEVVQFYPDSIPTNWRYIESFLDVQEIATINTGLQQVLLPNGSLYGFILIRSAASTNATTRTITAFQADATAFATASPIDVDTTGGFSLYDLNNTIKEQNDWQNIRSDFSQRITDALPAGRGAMMFNGGANELFDTRSQTNQLALNLQTRANANSPKFRVVYQRFNDPYNLLGLL